MSTYTGGYKAGDKQDEKESFTDGFRLPGCDRLDSQISVIEHRQEERFTSISSC